MLSAVWPPYPLTDPPQLRGQLALPRPPLARPRRPGGLVCPHRQLRPPLRALSIHQRRLPSRVVLGGCRRLCAAVGRALRRRRHSHVDTGRGHGLRVCVECLSVAACFQRNGLLEPALRCSDRRYFCRYGLSARRSAATGRHCNRCLQSQLHTNTEPFWPSGAFFLDSLHASCRHFQELLPSRRQKRLARTRRW
jgi:hypothetical protein